MKKLIIAISSLILLSATNAMSMDFKPSIGVSGSAGVFAATGIENNFNEGGTAIAETTKEHGAFQADMASIFVEIGLSDAISLGVDYVVNTLETPENVAREDGGTDANKVKAEFEDLTTVYAKLNLPLGGTYLKVGYAQVDVISIENLDSGNSHGNDKSTGIVAGIGYDHELSGGVAIRAELTGMDMSDVTSNNGQTNKTEIKVQDMIGARGKISLVKSF